MRTERSIQDKRNLHQAVANVQNYCKEQAEEIAKQFEKRPEYVNRLIHSSSIFKTTRNPNIFNALVHQKAKEINAGALWMIVAYLVFADSDF
jgi:predicted extracellular nuclease